MTTLKELARQLNVSVSTVSRALNGKKGVSDALRSRIVKLADKWGYYPDSNATALVKKRTGVLGVVIPRETEFIFTTTFFSHILMGANSAAVDAGYNILLSTGVEKDFTSLYYRKQVDGLLVIGNRVNDKKVLELEGSGIPNVLVPGFPEGEGPDLVTVNGEIFKSVKRTVNYLCSLGHKRIAFIYGAPTSKFSIVRLRALREAMAENNVVVDERYLIASDFSVRETARITGKLLNMTDPPTALLTINDSAALGALQEIERHGLTIPDDISFVVVGGSDVLEGHNPPITAIRIPIVDIGKKAVELLIRQIDGKSIHVRRYTFPTDLIVRESTGICRQPD